MEVYSEKAKWERAMDLYCSANEIEVQLQEGNPPSVEDLRSRLVEPYVNRSPDLRWPSADRGRVWHPDRHNLYSDQVEEVLRPGVATKDLVKFLKDLAGELIGPDYKIVET